MLRLRLHCLRSTRPSPVPRGIVSIETSSHPLARLRSCGAMLDAKVAPVVLVVEDTPELRDMYAEALNDAGLRVELAADGVEGVDKAIGLLPAVIVMDVNLPRQDGFTAIRLLR